MFVFLDFASAFSFRQDRDVSANFFSSNDHVGIAISLRFSGTNQASATERSEWQGRNTEVGLAIGKNVQTNFRVSVEARRIAVVLSNNSGNTNVAYDLDGVDFHYDFRFFLLQYLVDTPARIESEMKINRYFLSKSYVFYAEGGVFYLYDRLYLGGEAVEMLLLLNADENRSKSSFISWKLAGCRKRFLLKKATQ